MPSILETALVPIINSLGTSGYPAMQMLVFLILSNKGSLQGWKSKLSFYIIGAATLEIMSEFI